MIIRKSLLAIVFLALAMFPTCATTLHGWETNHDTSQFSIHIPKAHAQVAGVHTGSHFLEGAAMKFFTKFLEVFVVLNWVALTGVEALLDPDFIFGKPDAAGVRTTENVLHGIWLLSRNITNSIFAFILLAGGIYLIINAGGEGMSKIKQMAPKFVLAVILVNFSWFFPRVIFDASNVMSAAIYQLPRLVNPGFRCITDPGPDGIPDWMGVSSVGGDDTPCYFVWKVHLFPPSLKQCDISINKLPGCPRPWDGKKGRMIGNLLDIYYQPWSSVASSGKYTDDSDPAKPKDVEVSGAALIINGLATNFAKIPQLAVINFKTKVSGLSFANSSGVDQATAYLEFFVFLVLHVILSIAVGLALLAFMAVLIVRVGVLWLCIAFMPFIFIGTALGKGLGDLGREGAPNIWQKFLSYVLYPVLVAIPFSIGFTLASQLYYVESVTLPTAMYGLLPMKEIQSVHQFIWMIITICIIWFGVFAILEKDEFAGKIVGGIKGIGTTGLNIAKNAALYLPGLPLPAGMKTPGELLDAYRGAPYAMKSWRQSGGGGKGGGGTTMPAPQPHEVQENIGKLDSNQITDLKNTLLQLPDKFQRGNEAAAIDDLARKLNFQPEQVRTMLSTIEGRRSVLEAKDSKGNRILNDSQRDNVMHELDKYHKELKSKNESRFKLEIESKDPDVVRQKTIESLLGVIDTGVSGEEMERAAQNVVEKSKGGDVNMTSTLQQILTAVQAGQREGGKTKIKEKLMELQKVPTASSSTPTASITPAPRSPDQNDPMLAHMNPETYGTPNLMNDDLARGGTQSPDQPPDEETGFQNYT